MNRLWKSAIDMPPTWLVAFLLLVWAQTKLWNPAYFGGEAAQILGWGLICIGLGVMVWSFLQFRKMKTSIVPRNTPSAFIAGGPYQFSRNPIYLADALVLLGFSLLFGSLIGIGLTIVFMAVIQIRFIHGEEAGLRGAFPKEAETYFARTRRWL